MKILNLKLRGFLGIQRGMGLEEISVDLSNLSGLIALAGQNGKGKSTVLESLQPYRTLASRNTSLKNHVYLRDSSKELTFTLNGDEFRTLVKIDSGSDRSEGFIWRNGQPQVDGKVRSFDRYLTELLGSPELFFNSVFAAQGSKKISDLTTGELKKLFSEFLRLDRLEAYEQTSKQAANSITLITTRIAQDISALNGIEDQIATYRAESDAAIAALKMTAKKQLEAREAFAVADIAVTDAAETVNKNALISVRIEETRKQIAQAREDYGKEMDVYLKGADVLKTAYRMVKGEIDGLNTLLADEPAVRQAAQTAKDANSKWKDSIKQTDEAQTRVDELTAGVTRLTAEHVAAAKADAEKIAEKTQTIRDAEQLIKDIRKNIADLNTDTEVSVLEITIGHYRQQAEDLKCAIYSDGSQCRSENCKLLAGAIDAEKKLAVSQEQMEARKKAITEKVAALEANMIEETRLLNTLLLDRTLATGEAADAAAKREAVINGQKKHLSGWTESLKQLRIKAATHKQECEAADLLAAKLPEIDQAAGKLVPAQARLKEIADEGIEKRTKWESREKNMLSSISALEDVAKTQEDAIDKDAETKLTTARQSVENIRAQIAQTEKEIAASNARIDVLQRDIEEAEKKLAQRVSLDAEKTVKDREASEWIYLKNACGASGLRALEIDSVAPTITGWANDLLSGTFGPQYTVQFRTQDPETGREVLDILALSDDGSEILLENLSGGQKVWILKALRLAMTLVSKEKSGMDFRSSFADEEDGSLDSLNAQNFIGMYRSFMKSGGFDDLFFISHRPSCVEMADHILTFREGGIDIE